MESKEKTLGTRATIFRRTDKEIPELRQTANAVKAADMPTAKRSRIKATFYLYPEDILAIDAMQSDEFRRTNKKPERSEIVSRALQALKKQNDL